MLSTLSSDDIENICATVICVALLAFMVVIARTLGR